MEEKELFEDYEIRGWEMSPKMYKILGAALALQLFAIFTLAQFNLLQTKACDSPYVGKVCQVLDAAYLGSVFLGEDTQMVDEAYVKSEIADADITFIDVSGAEPPFTYPEGYFALANPDQLAQTQPIENNFSGDLTNGSQNNPSTLDLNQPQILPTPNNDLKNQPLPDSPFSFGDDSAASKPKPSRVPAYRPPTNRFPTSKQSKIKNESPNKLPNLPGDTTANNANANANANQKQDVAKNNSNNANKTAGAEEEDKAGINQKPFKDFGAKYSDQILSKDININAPFTIEITATLDENGKLINPKMVTTTDSDPKMTDVAKEAILAFSDSRLLKPLYEVGGRKVIITFAQNEDNLQAIIKTETKSENQAKILQSGLNFYIKNFFKPKEGSDEQVLMKKAEFNTQGNLFIINFLISNDEKTQMIEKNLKHLKEETEKKSQPNSVAVSSNADAKS